MDELDYEPLCRSYLEMAATAAFADLLKDLRLEDTRLELKALNLPSGTSARELMNAMMAWQYHRRVVADIETKLTQAAKYLEDKRLEDINGRALSAERNARDGWSD